ncbi:MAG: dihydropteroate synthase, partial [Gemmatimonadota bacterium]
MVGTDVPVIMGVLNVTPDSFSDGGELAGVAGALYRAVDMVREGATILDVGGESTRPGAAPVPERREVERVVPVIEALVQRLDVVVSVDTRKSGVARAALDAGAHVVNDVSGLASDPAMAEVVAASGAGLVLMHMRGTPGDMDERTDYRDLVGEVVGELGRSLERARAGGVEAERIVVDPG